MHPRWRSQIASLDLPEVPVGRGWLASSMGDGAADASAPAVLLRTLAGLTRLPRLIPPPGAGPSDVDIDLAGGTHSPLDDDPVLTRVRALLSQAESTTYPAEAEAFTAKAHALMTRHAIHAALLDQSVGDGWTTALRIPIEDPYVDSKSLLLHVVAEHSRCRAVVHARYAMCTVVGANGDVFATELLFTSLLLQAQQALLAEGDHVGAGALQRSRSFRSVFPSCTPIASASVWQRSTCRSSPRPRPTSRAGRCFRCWPTGRRSSTTRSTGCSAIWSSSGCGPGGMRRAGRAAAAPTEPNSANPICQRVATHQRCRRRSRITLPSVRSRRTSASFHSRPRLADLHTNERTYAR